MPELNDSFITAFLEMAHPDWTMVVLKSPHHCANVNTLTTSFASFIIFSRRRREHKQFVSFVNAEKLLADPAQLQLVKDAKTSLKLPAEGALSFEQKR
jgi:hypothetical protein